DARRVNGLTVLATGVAGLDDKGLRELADRLRDRIKSGVVVLGTALGERAVLLAAVTKDLTGRYHAGNIIKQLAPLVGGGGGGRPDFAQAGGKDPARLDAALAAAYELLGAGSGPAAWGDPPPLPSRCSSGTRRSSGSCSGTTTST